MRRSVSLSPLFLLLAAPAFAELGPFGNTVCAVAGAQVIDAHHSISPDDPVISDGAGGCFVAWEDHRAGNRDIYVQHVLSDGTVAWTANGVAVCTSVADQNLPRLCSDGAGGIYVAWIDGRSDPPRGYAQVIDNTGAPQWPTDGIPIASATLDVQGRRLKTLHRGALPAGAHEFTWDGRGFDGGSVAKGAYFVRLSTRGRTETRRVTLVR